MLAFSWLPRRFNSHSSSSLRVVLAHQKLFLYNTGRFFSQLSSSSFSPWRSVELKSAASDSFTFMIDDLKSSHYWPSNERLHQFCPKAFAPSKTSSLSQSSVVLLLTVHSEKGSAKLVFHLRREAVAASFAYWILTSREVANAKASSFTLASTTRLALALASASLTSISAMRWNSSICLRASLSASAFILRMSAAAYVRACSCIFSKARRLCSSSIFLFLSAASAAAFALAAASL